MKKETNVCLFEKDSRFGGRDYDVRFSRAPNIAISLGAWRVDKKHKKVMDLARRVKIPMLEMGHVKAVLFEARGFYASNLQSLKEQAFATLLSGPFANMTSSELYKYAWLNVTREKALEVPSYRDFLCQQFGNNFTVSTKKLIIAVPSFAFKEITGDVAAEIESNPLFEAILPHPAFKAAAIYSYPWWENVTSSHYNLTMKPFEIFRSGATCLVGTMPYSGRGPQGEAVIQLSYAWRACAIKWGEISKLSKAVFETELKKAVQEVFPGVVIPEPLEIVFKYWEEVAWYVNYP
ncbi:hypothetical protein OS493_022192 [Desmophyllum pertusum]|uniref:Amine oxidase domain-containing protein n=1 Tax=Desmophyllum pertusum TaxID=174260 RepID=A0A9X0CE58_9CNID|nr:hypothetical protein OS493_022192 [Desmophyllum pertusum]